MIATAQSTSQVNPALRARVAGSRIGELIALARRPLTERQLRELFEATFNTTRAAVQFARVAIEARNPIVPRAYGCPICGKQQDIDGGCINCGHTVRANVAKAAA